MEQWYENFLINPEQAITDLFSGRAGLGSSLRLDIPELLYQEFPETPEFIEPRQWLDEALLVWLHTMRRQYAAQVKRLGYGVYSKRLCDALITVQLLNLPRTTYSIRETLDSWLNWLTPLRLAPERDPALECWRVLTHRQTAETNPAQWIQLAQDPRPEYLRVALVGLQRMPNGHDARRNQQTQLLALLHHAVLLPDSKHAFSFFEKNYAALRATYPASPEHWQTLLEATLNGFQMKSQLAQALKEKLQPPKAKSKSYSTVANNAVQSTDKIDFDKLLNDIKQRKQAVESLAQRFFKQQDKNYAYSQATGESHFFIRTLSNLGTRLLKQHGLSAATLNQFQQMIERGLSLEPMDSYIWMLWADLLAYSGQNEAQQWVLRETVRLFPDHEPSRVELARLLIRQGNNTEAEYWLREAAERNPNKEPSRVELARLLIRQGNDSEAEKWLGEVIAFSPNNEPSRNELARLLIQRYMENKKADDLEQAEKLLQEVIKHNSNAEQSYVVLARLWLIQGKNLEAVQLLENCLQRVPNNKQMLKLLTLIQTHRYDLSSWQPFHELEFDAHQSSFAQKPVHIVSKTTADASLLSELERRATLHTAFQKGQIETLANNAAEGDALACFYQQWLSPDNTLTVPPHAWAAQACRLYQTYSDADAWQQLDNTFPEQRLNNRFLRLQLTQDEQEIAALLKKLSNDIDAQTPVQRFMHRILQNPHSQQSDSSVFAVLASGAINAPQFVC